MQKAEKPLWDNSRFHFAIITCLAFILYIPTLSYQLTYYDDATLIDFMQTFIKGHHAFYEIFAQNVFGSAEKGTDSYYRPVLTLSFYLNILARGTSPAAFHLVNIMLHALAGCLVYAMMKKFKFDRKLSLAGSLMLIAHPALVQAVAWIPGRNDSLLTILSLTSLLFLAEYIEQRKTRSFLLHLLFFSLALLTKETAVLLPVLFVISVNIFLRNTTSELLPVREKIPGTKKLFVSWFILIASFLFVRQVVAGSSIGLPLRFTLVNFIGNLPAIIQYTGKMLLPFELSTFPVLQNTSYLFGIITIALTGYLLYVSKLIRFNYLLLAVSWWLIFLLPAILRTTDEYESVFLEHRLYFPFIGFLLLWVETDFIKKINWSSPYTKISAAAILILFSALTFINCKNYQNELSYWSRAVATSPDASFAYRGLGTSYYTSGKTPDAEKAYLMAMQLNPNLKDVRNNLGRIYMNNGNPQKAALLFREELKINPASAVTYYNLALLQLDQKKLPEAESLIRKSLSLKPDYLDAQNDLCVILAMQKRYEEAATLCIQVLVQHPDYASARQNLILIFKSWNDSEKVQQYKDMLQQKGIRL